LEAVFFIVYFLCSFEILVCVSFCRKLFRKLSLGLRKVSMTE
jgi:hypothetical protein